MISCTSCKKDNAPTIPTTNIGDTFTIKANECKTLIDRVDNKTYNLCFTDSINDGRCLQSDCYLCYGSEAIIGITWINNQSQDSANIALKIIGCYSSDDCNVDFKKDTLGYSFCFLKLVPYPDTNNVPINQNDYIAKLKITKL